MHCFTYRGIKENDKFNQARISLRKKFDNSIREIFGPEISPDEFPGVNLEDKNLYDMYEDDTTDAGVDLTDKSADNEIPVMDN